MWGKFPMKNHFIYVVNNERDCGMKSSINQFHVLNFKSLSCVKFNFPKNKLVDEKFDSDFNLQQIFLLLIKKIASS